jgi:hypothetical protein
MGGVLLRRFIGQSLEIYFSRLEVVARSQPLHFTQLLNRFDYRSEVSKLYKASTSGWLTPVTVFQPWYSYSLARYLQNQHAIQLSGPDNVKTKKPLPLVVYEIGGGDGTNARNILDWLKRHAPATYLRCQYTLLEFSPRLRDAQAAAVADHGERASIIAADATDLRNALQSDDRPCYVIGLEVLDNLPHDKAVCINGVWHEASVVDEGSPHSSADDAPGQQPQHLSEAYAPITDPLIRGLLGVAKSMGLPSLTAGVPTLPPVRGRLWHAAKTVCSGSVRGAWVPLPRSPPGVQHAVYLPTGALQLLRGLRGALPRHRLILADFDGLPEPDVHARTVSSDNQVRMYCPAHCSPINASKDPVERRTIDHLTYLSPRRGTADALFPTDFTFLAEIIRHEHRVSCDTPHDQHHRPSITVEVMPSHRFLGRYGDVAQTRTMSGYNPMLEDYANTSILLT